MCQNKPEMCKLFVRQCRAGHITGKLSQVQANAIPGWKTELQEEISDELPCACLGEMPAHHHRITAGPIPATEARRGHKSISYVPSNTFFFIETMGHYYTRRNSGMKGECSNEGLWAGPWAAAAGRRQWWEHGRGARSLWGLSERGKRSDCSLPPQSVALGKPLHFPASFHSEAERFASFWSQNILIVKCLMFSHNFDRIWILGVIFQSHLQKTDSVSSQGKLLSGKHPSNGFPVQGHILGSGFNFPLVCDI